MTNYESDWIFDIGLKIAVAIFLATLAMGLVTGVAPLTAVYRSGAAFAVFVIIGWAAAQVWEPTRPKKEEESEENAADAETRAARPDGQPKNAEPFDRLDANQTAQQAA